MCGDCSQKRRNVCQRQSVSGRKGIGFQRIYRGGQRLSCKYQTCDEMKSRELYMRNGNIITVGRERFKHVRKAILDYWKEI